MTTTETNRLVGKSKRIIKDIKAGNSLPINERKNFLEQVKQHVIKESLDFEDLKLLIINYNEIDKSN